MSEQSPTVKNLMPKRVWIDTSTIKPKDIGIYSEGVEIFYGDDGDPDDVEYIRADLAAEEKRELEAENKRLRKKVNSMVDIMGCNDPGNAKDFAKETP